MVLISRTGGNHIHDRASVQMPCMFSEGTSGENDDWYEGVQQERSGGVGGDSKSATRTSGLAPALILRALDRLSQIMRRQQTPVHVARGSR